MPEHCWQTVGLKQFMAVNVCTKPILQFTIELALAKYSIISSRLILLSLLDERQEIGAIMSSTYIKIWRRKKSP